MPESRRLLVYFTTVDHCRYSSPPCLRALAVFRTTWWSGDERTCPFGNLVSLRNQSTEPAKLLFLACSVPLPGQVGYSGSRVRANNPKPSTESSRQCS